MTIHRRLFKPEIPRWSTRTSNGFSRLALIATVASSVVAPASCSLAPHNQRTTSNSESAKALIPLAGVEHLDRLTREPMVVEVSGGALIVVGYDGELGSGPNMYRSDDHGANWVRVDVGRMADGAIGNSDVDLAVGPDGTLYLAAMTYDRKKDEGTRIAVGASRDAGATWSWKVVSEARFDDRPWVAATPDGAAHVIWNDGSGVRYAVSGDRGASWTERPRISEQGGSSHLAVGPHGELAVRVTPLSASGNIFTPGVDLIAVSRDGGKTWQKHRAPGTRDWSIDDDKETLRWVEPIAWDAGGSLYYLWGSQKGVWVARSLDLGETWTSWHIVERDELSYFPYLTARGPGELAATWTSGEDDDLRVHVATIRFRNEQAPPQVIEAQPFQTDIWSRPKHSGDPPHRSTGGEYVPVTFLQTGNLGVVTTIQNLGEKRLGFKWWRFMEH